MKRYNIPLKLFLLILSISIFNSTARATNSRYIEKLGETEADTVSIIRAVALPDGRLVTAVRAGRSLKLILWSISGDGRVIKRLGDHGAGTVKAIDAAVLPNGNIVTAVANGRSLPAPLTLIVWKVEGNSIRRLGDAKAGAVSIIKAVALPDGRLVTAVRTGNYLKLILWSISGDGWVIKRLADHRAGTVKAIDAVVLPDGNVVTAVANGQSLPVPLKLIVWKVEGNAIRRLGEAKAGTIHNIDSVVLPNGHFLTGVRTGDDLKLIVWEISEDGKTITRLGSKVIAKNLNAVWVDVLQGGRVLTVSTSRDQITNRPEVWRISDNGRGFQSLAQTTRGRGGRTAVLPNGIVVAAEVRGGRVVVRTLDTNAPVDEIPDQTKAKLLSKYSPRVWLHSKESYRPSSVEWSFKFLERKWDTREGHWRLITQESLGSPSSVLNYFHGANPKQVDEVPAYAFWHWVDNHTADLLYFFYYPYNRGKEKFDTVFGNHVGDWEHVTVRLSREKDEDNGWTELEPSKLYLASHDHGETARWSAVPKVQGTEHPVIYAARGSHGSYLKAGDHTYKGGLVDHTDKGTAWETWHKLECFDYDAQQKGLGPTWQGTWPKWLEKDTRNENLGNEDPASGPVTRWGNYRSGSVAGYWRLENGPTGPADKPYFETVALD